MNETLSTILGSAGLFALLGAFVKAWYEDRQGKRGGTLTLISEMQARIDALHEDIDKSEARRSADYDHFELRLDAERRIFNEDRERWDKERSEFASRLAVVTARLATVEESNRKLMEEREAWEREREELLREIAKRDQRITELCSLLGSGKCKES